jgi:hypothetical protein
LMPSRKIRQEHQRAEYEASENGPSSIDADHILIVRHRVFDCDIHNEDAAVIAVESDFAERCELVIQAESLRATSNLSASPTTDSEQEISCTSKLRIAAEGIWRFASRRLVATSGR